MSPWECNVYLNKIAVWQSFGILAKDPLISGTHVGVSSFSQELLLLLI